jgi:ElaB/YqjD/DUF883 family membrane-anchored ribosome-binding protein
MDDQNKSVNERWAPGAEPAERGYATDPQFTSGEYAGDQRGAEAPRADEDPTRRTRELRSEIDRTRGEMSETIDAIQDRLSPRNVVSRAADSVKEATVGRVRQMAHTVHDRMPSSGNEWGGGFIDRVRDNPVPAAIAAVSLAWLAFGGRRQPRQQFGPAIYGSTRDGQAFIRETRIATPDEFGVGEDSGNAWSSVGQYAEDATRRTQQSVEAAGERIQETMSRAGDRMREATWDARHRAQRLQNQNPLAAGALAAAVGLAIGLAIPESDRENELMGPARDSLVDRGREAARNAAERVQDVANDVQRVAGKAVDAASPDRQSPDVAP